MHGLEPLETPNVRGCCRLNELPENPRSLALCTNKLDCLPYLNLEISCGLLEIPNSFGSLLSLRKLTLTRNSFEKMPADIKQLPELTELILEHCKSLRWLPELPITLHHWNVKGCISLESIESIFTRAEKEYVWSCFWEYHQFFWLL
jgi:hypothetical protein